MAKPELGTKRLCAGCGAKFYDLNKDPITCPKCGTVYEVAVAAPRGRPDAAAARAAAAQAAGQRTIAAGGQGHHLLGRMRGQGGLSVCLAHILRRRTGNRFAGICAGAENRASS